MKRLLMALSILFVTLLVSSYTPREGMLDVNGNAVEYAGFERQLFDINTECDAVPMNPVLCKCNTDPRVNLYVKYMGKCTNWQCGYSIYCFCCSGKCFTYTTCPICGHTFEVSCKVCSD